jgi:hypothetical protein
MLLAGGVWHAFPELDIYGYAGQESQCSKWGFSTPSTAHTAFGWGNPFYINTGCNIEDLGGAAGAGGGGFACTGGIGGSQERNENMFLTSLRYYPF